MLPVSMDGGGAVSELTGGGSAIRALLGSSARKGELVDGAFADRAKLPGCDCAVPGERLTYLARSIDNSIVHLVFRDSTAGSVQKAS
jgi:hypothetical protein